MASHLYKYLIIHYSILVQADETIICIDSESYTILPWNNNTDDCINTTLDIAIYDQPIVCPQNEDCLLQCIGSHSCDHTTFNCPANKTCYVECYDASSCSSSTINAMDSSNLFIDCIGDKSCANINIFCPINSTNIGCSLRGTDTVHSNLNIYTMNGWKDIDVAQYNGTINITNNHNMMHCNYVNNNYTDSCLVSSLWSCMDPVHICNGYRSGGDGGEHIDNGNNGMIIGGVAGLVLLICFLCALCCLTQYRKRREDMHATETKRKQKQKVQMYGADAMDDTLYVGEDDAVEMFDVNENARFTLHGIRVVSDGDDEFDVDGFNVDEDELNQLNPKQHDFN